MEETKRDRQRQKEKNNVKNKNHSVRKHRMNKVLGPFPCSITEKLNENVSNANITLFLSFYILNQVLRTCEVFLFSESTFERLL